MRSTMGRRAYSSDLTDKQWEVLRPLIPLPSLEGRPATVERRELVNAMLYVLRSGCPCPRDAQRGAYSAEMPLQAHSTYTF